VQALEPTLPLLGAQTISEVIDRSLWASRMGAALLSVFGLIALTLTAVGIYGVLAYLVEQRTHEIGLRMALGARRGDILKLVIRQGLILVIIGSALGLAAGLAATRLIASQLFGAPGSDPSVFLLTFLLLAGVALLATYIPARRATRIKPIIALRNE
jgi:putative ABC transport system permease protein